MIPWRQMGIDIVSDSKKFDPEFNPCHKKSVEQLRRCLGEEACRRTADPLDFDSDRNSTFTLWYHPPRNSEHAGYWKATTQRPDFKIELITSTPGTQLQSATSDSFLQDSQAELLENDTDVDDYSVLAQCGSCHNHYSLEDARSRSTRSPAVLETEQSVDIFYSFKLSWRHPQHLSFYENRRKK